MVEKTSLQLKRSHCTLVASIASNENIQNVLPQVLLPKMVGKKKKWASALELHALPPNIHIIPDTNGWMDLKIFKQYLNLLRDALAPLHPPKSYLSWIATQVIILGKHFHCFADGSGKCCSSLASSRGSCNPWMPGSSPLSKNNYTSQRCTQI